MASSPEPKISVGLKMSLTEFERFDHWRRQHPAVPSLSEAVRTLVRIALDSIEKEAKNSDRSRLP
jgi:hypothetical protein